MINLERILEFCGVIAFFAILYGSTFL